MKIFGYCRVSTLDQSNDLQKEEILKAYPDALVRHEKVSGTSLDNRDMLKLLLEMLDKGDKLVVFKLDRLARNMNDLTKIVETIAEKQASLEILDQKIDTSTASGKAFLQMLGVFAEFETNLRRERQLAGIARAKREAPERYKGRSVSVDVSTIKRLLECGTSPSEVARRVGVSRATVYRYR